MTTMAALSAGILLHRRRSGRWEVFLIHPGGPFWKGKDLRAWSIPKGLVDRGENPLAAARREYCEETGLAADGAFEELGVFRQPGGKRLQVWALEGDCDPCALKSNAFELEWPPKSGRRLAFPEADRGAWFARGRAQLRIVRGRRPMLDRFYAMVCERPLAPIR